MNVMERVKVVEEKRVLNNRVMKVVEKRDIKKRKSAHTISIGMLSGSIFSGHVAFF
jgi:hypothetical protein